MFKPFDYPEINKLLRDLLNSLFDESGRGALLIATAHVDDHLTGLIEAMLPKDLAKSHKNKLFSYPGHLSSFSSKIELAYSFRLINRSLYDSLNAMRKLRNDAAHSSNKFELHDLNEKLKSIYELGPGFPYFIKKISTEAMVEYKLEGVKKIMEEFNITNEEKNNVIKSVLNDDEKLSEIEKQIPFWELLYGLCFLCGLIVYYKENIQKLTSDINTLSDLVASKS